MSSTRLPAELLNPIPILRRPWSNIAVDFVTDLPPFAGHATILTVVDRFSKAVYFIPLPMLPSVSDTGDLLVKHVFHFQGLSRDNVSD